MRSYIPMTAKPLGYRRLILAAMNNAMLSYAAAY